jgi:hypothetical protein
MVIPFAPEKQDVRWFLIVVVSWAMLFGWSTTKALLPVSLWFTVEYVRVADTPVGGVPEMDVRRTIVRPFRGEWLAQVNKVTPEQRLEVVCQAAGKNFYQAENDLPDNLDLNWWTFPIVCQLPEGLYRLHTVWTVKPEGFADKLVEAKSNDFRILPAIE